MDKVRKLEELTIDLLANVIREKKVNFLDNGYVLESEIERVFADSYYESEVYVLLKNDEGVQELYPIQIAFALKNEEPLLYVNQESFANLEKEVRVEISQWEEKYLAKEHI